MEKICLFVVSHKDLDISLFPDRNIIFVGKNKEVLKEKYKDNPRVYFDDEGDNIADLNYTYCEMTAHYWIWKNFKDAEIISIEHYRRLYNNVIGKPRNKEFLLKQLEHHDIITAINWCFTGVNGYMFKRAHGKNNYKAMLRAIEEVAPDYLVPFKRRMRKTSISYFNMMCLKKEDFDKYMEFVWPILENVRNHIMIPKTGYNSRMMGFIAERLLSPYIDKNKLKRKGLLVYKIERKKKRA